MSETLRFAPDPTPRATVPPALSVLQTINLTPVAWGSRREAKLAKQLRDPILPRRETMSLNPRCLALNQITCLVQSVNKKNYKSTCTELAAVSWRARRGGPT